MAAVTGRKGPFAGLLVILCLLGVSRAGAEAEKLGELIHRVDRGDVSGAVQRYRALYASPDPEGLRVLHEVALEILRVGAERVEPYERPPLAAVLALHDDPQAYTWLEADLDSPNRLVRQAAAVALAEIGSDRATTLLRDLYAEGGDSRLLALDVLARAGNRGAVDLFLRAMRAPDPRLRMAAMRGIGELRVADARSSLHDVWAENADPLLSGYAAYCLARLGDERAHEALAARLRDRRADTRDQAAALLGFLGDPGVAPSLRETLFDPSDFVRVSAIASLTRFRDASGLAVARRLLEHEEFSVRLAVATSFERMDYAVARPLVLEALRAEDPNVRAHALHAIREFEDLRSSDLVQRFLAAEQDEFVRTEALLVLGHVGDATALPELLDAIPGGQVSLRHAAAEGLVALTDRLARTPHAGDSHGP